MKKTNLVLGFMLIMLLAMSTRLMAAGIEPIGNPREVSSLDHLLWISTNSSSWGDDFIQTENIYFTNSDFEIGGNFYNSGAGFIPIGNSTSKFTGSYDGDGHTIDHLFIYLPSTAFTGLFGYALNGTIENLGVINVDITGGSSHTGGLVGVADYITVSNSYSTGSVNGCTNTGGLVGMNYASSTISNSYSTGSVTRSSGTETSFGGFCGSDYLSTIKYCYSIGDVFESDCVVWDEGDNKDKGFIGVIVGTVILASNFFDSEASNQTTATGATDKTTAEMNNIATFTNTATAGLTTTWDFKGIGETGVWNIGNDHNDGYPYLDWQFPSDPALPVTLSSFTVSYSKNNVVLNWITQSETDNLGFNLYRSESENGFGNSQVLNSTLIPGMGTTSTPINYSFADEYPNIDGHIYYYWLQSVSTTNELELFCPVSIVIPIAGQLPIMTILSANYPNPFNPETTISFDIKENEKGILTIFNIKGQSILKETFEAGNHQYHWNADGLSSGMYFYKLSSPTTNITKKMILMK
jgi:Secretion system C-terminal sorting domain/The GLUG motif